MSFEEALDLIHDIIESTRLVTVRGGDAITVHRVGDPQRVGIARLDRFEQGWQSVTNLSSTHSSDESQATRLTVGVKLLNESLDRIHVSSGAKLHTDGVANA